ncbi:MAG: hypothetical protein LBL91_05275 [Lachnospiraceae bacterium]|jgi:membrane-bound acyltransferase YfiQ involved in biofilm formation|nr:hypothetical protein [Lachnospiraceae bacterium]
MKKPLLVILIVFALIMIVLLVLLQIAKSNEAEIKSHNIEYENLLNKEIYGTEVTSVINKAIDNNEKNNIQKDADGQYISDDANSIKIDLKMISQEGTYSMEDIEKLGIVEFSKYFNTVLFKCTGIEYHKDTKKISKIVFEQLTN